MSAAKHTPGQNPFEGMSLSHATVYTIPNAGHWAVFGRGDVKFGELVYTTSATHGEGWKFYPHDQGLPSRRMWSAAWRAIPRRFRGGVLACVDVRSPAYRAAIAKATGSAA
jgi:hypothetical protein